MDIKTLIAVATGKIPHNYRSSLCPDEIQPDSRDPDCPACKILTDAAAEYDEMERRLREAEARVAELEAERAEREKQEPALYVQSNHFAQAKFSPFLARVCQQPIEGIATMPLYAASTVTAQSEGQIDKATSLLRRAADYLGYAGAPRLASEISSYLESQAQPPRGEG